MNIFKKKPLKILTDNGTCYKGKEFNEFMRKNEIKQKYCTANNPTCNGISERINKTIKELLRIYKGQSIKQAIIKINTALNVFYHKTIKTSPFELVFGYNYFNKIPSSIDRYKIARENTIAQGYKTNRLLNNSRIANFKFNIGDNVFVKAKINSSLDQIWDGPFLINGKDELGNRIKVKIKGKSIWHNIKNLKPFKGGDNVVKN